MMTDGSAVAVGSSVSVTEEAIVIRIVRPAEAGRARSDRAARLAFAARGDAYAGLIMWHRFEAVYAVLADRVAAVDPAEQDVYTRVYDPLCQVAASYAVAAGVRQHSAELFVEDSVACFERIPAVGRLMRDGVIAPSWFRRAVEQTSLVEDADLLEFIDDEIAHRLTVIGGLTAKRVEHAVAEIVAEHDPDAAVLTREQVKAHKQVVVNPLTDGMSELIVTASAEDAAVCKDAVDAVIAGVCRHDRRTKGQLRSDAAVARLTGAAFECACGRHDCDAELSEAAVAARCARIVLHVVVRKETLDGTAQTPALLDGYGPISAAHARELASRAESVRRELNLDDLVAHPAQEGNAYRPSTALDTAVRGLFGTCSWIGCDRPAWKCDLDHVTEFNHADPAAGGPTCHCNLNPKCKFHHGLKTHAGGWLDDQVVDANGVIWTEVTTPEGLTVRRQAANQWLLPELGSIPCRHGGSAQSGSTRPENGHAELDPKRARTRLEAKHAYRRRQRAANRRAHEAARAEFEAADDLPPF